MGDPDSRPLSPIRARVLPASLIPLAALATVALAGLADLPLAGYLALAAGAGLITVGAVPLLLRIAALDPAARSARDSAGSSATILAALCVFALGAGLVAANVLRAFGPDGTAPRMEELRSIPGSIPVAGSAIEPAPPSPGPETADEPLARWIDLSARGEVEAAAQFFREGLAAAGEAGAIPAMERALALCDEHHGADVGLRETVFARLADLLRAEARHDDLVAAIAIHVRRLETADPAVSSSAIAGWREEAGRILGAQGRFQESADHFDRAVALRDGDAAGDPLKAAFTRVNLARSLLGAGHRDRALSVLEAARKVLDQRLPPEHDARRAADSLLGEIAGQLPN